MANAFFAGGSGASWDLLVETAFNQIADFALRDMAVWRPFATVKPARQAMPGDSVTFTIHQDLGLLGTSAALTETVDPDAVAPQAPTRVNVPLVEYGRATLQTNVLNQLNFTRADYEQGVIVSRDMVDYIDQTIRVAVDQGTNGLQVAGTSDTYTQGTTTSSITTGWNLGRNGIAIAAQYMRGKKVLPNSGDNFTGIVHPHVAFDVMAQNSATAWVGPHTYGTDTGAVYSGRLGSLLGVDLISTTRVTTATDGAASAKVYRSYVLGQQAIAEAVAVDPHIVVGPVVDKLKRFNPLGWYALAGWKIYRPEASLRIFSSSSLASYT